VEAVMQPNCYKPCNVNPTMSIAALRAEFEATRQHPTAWVKERLAEARNRDAKGHIYTQLLPDRAGACAAVCDARWAAGGDAARWPLLGVPVALKDNIDLEGTETSCGRRPAAPPALADAGIVCRLESAGAVILGKTNLDESALGASGRNERFGRCINPREAHLSSGGSSSGSAASVAAGHTLLALGTDTLGSVRIPAAFCGVAGFKPTYDRLDRVGVAPLHPDFDTVGLIAGSLQDLEHAAMALLPGFTRPAGTPPRAPLWILGEAALADADPAIAEGYNRCVEILRRRGAFELTRLPPWEVRALARAAFWEVAHGFAALCRAAASGAADLDKMGTPLRHLLERAESLPPERRAAGRAMLADSAQRLNQWLAGSAAILTPTCPVQPPAADAETPRNLAEWVTPANVAGLPALCWPQRLEHGAGISLQLIGRSGADESLLALGNRVQLILDGAAGDDART
jgi:aspartyl-tRNA(Asn)/glutamyl-tRNA(Gln) amidotransferase subunit A